MKQTSFRIIDNTGRETVCDIIATYHHDTSNKDFMVYTDKTLTNDNNLRLYYSLYENLPNGIRLINVNLPEDNKIGLQLVQEIIKELK